MNEKLIYEHLKQMGQGQDMETLRNFSSALSKVVDYNRQKLEELSEKIDGEIKDTASRYYIYGTVADKRDAPFVNHFLFPMEEAEDSITVFLPWNQEELRSFCREKKQLVIEENGEIREEALWFRPAEEFLHMAEELAEEFYHNSVYYSNFNLPYLFRFFKLFREGEDEPLSGDISAIWLKGQSEPLLIDKAPYWNVKKQLMPCAVFPVPAKDESYYEHLLEMPDRNDGYIVAGSQDTAQVFYRDKYIVVRTRLEEAKTWEVFQIISPAEKERTISFLPFTTNQRRMTHTDRQAGQAVRMPRTKKEIFRILSSYVLGDNIEAEEIRIVEEFPKGSVRSGEIRKSSMELFEKRIVKPCIQIKFQVKKPDFTTREQIAFLMGELETYFPEYEFAGDII